MSKLRAASRRRTKTSKMVPAVVVSGSRQWQDHASCATCSPTRGAPARVAVVSNEFGELGIDAALLSNVR
jgi:hypothetical protein